MGLHYSAHFKVLLILVLSTLATPCIGMPWTKLSGRVCRPGGTFSSLVQAQTACVHLGSSCHGVYDEHCDTRKLHVCKASPYSTLHGAGCLHYKLTTSLPVYTVKRFTPTTGPGLRSAVQTCLAKSPNGNCARCFFTETEDFPPGEVHDITSQEDLKNMQATGKVMVINWHADWCGPCQDFELTFQQMAEEQTDVMFCKIDVGETDELAELISKPTFQLFVGTEEVATFSGDDEASLQRLIDRHNGQQSFSAAPDEVDDIPSEEETTHQPKGNAKKSLPTSVKEIQSIMVNDMQVPQTLVQGLTEKDELIKLYVKQFSLKEMQQLLEAHGVPFHNFLERSEYTQAVIKLVRETMNK